MGLDMRDFENYVKQFKSMEKDFKHFLINFLTKEGYVTLADIKKNTPHDTHHLQNSWELKDIKYENGAASFTVYNPVEEYASIIEYGTPARPNWKWAGGAHMMTNGVYKELDRFPKEFDKAFTAFLKQKGLL